LTRYDFKAPSKQRLDQFLEGHLHAEDPHHVKNLISLGHVFVEGKRSFNTTYTLREGMRVVVHDSDPQSDPAIDILHADDYFVVINKAVGDHVNQTETSARLSLIEKIQRRYPDACIVHRLDKETTGVLIFSRGKLATRALNACFEQRRIRKTYLALVEGEAPLTETFEGRLSRDPRSPRTYRVHSAGKQACTELRSLGSVDGISAVCAKPLTGRTHQIRVHLSHAGLPILGDRHYGGPSAVRLGAETLTVNRVMLHAARIEIPVDSMPWSATCAHNYLRFSAKIPADLREFSHKGLALDAVFA
jgi:RluA family pseudouridine synthase